LGDTSLAGEGEGDLFHRASILPRRGRKLLSIQYDSYTTAPVTLDGDLVQARRGGRVLDHLPGPGERLRCTACGNLTRFDVVTSGLTTGFWQFSVSGELAVEGECG